MFMRLGLDNSSYTFTERKSALVSSFSTEKAYAMAWSNMPERRVRDFATSGVIRMTRLAQSTCNNQHGGKRFFSVLVKGKYVVRIAADAPIVVDGVHTTMGDFYSSVLAL